MIYASIRDRHISIDGDMDSLKEELFQIVYLLLDQHLSLEQIIEAVYIGATGTTIAVSSDLDPFIDEEHYPTDEELADLLQEIALEEYGEEQEGNENGSIGNIPC